MFWSLLLVGGLKNVLPTGPVLDPDQRARYDRPVPSGAHYTGGPREAFPIIPVQVWGLRYALDVVIETVDPSWTMHEYARVDMPGNPLWIAKDADHDGVQYITSPVDDPAGWLPEIPVPRFHGAVDVVDHSTPDRADLAFTYQSPKHEKMEVTYAGAMPTKPSKPRNGNTMGHSRASLSALLDIHLMRSGGDAHLRINGVESKMKKLLGLYPMKFILGQTQGGLAIADYFQSLAGAAPTDPAGLASFGLRRPAEVDPSNPWPTHGQESWTVENGWARRDGPVVSLSYHFTNGELDRAQAWQKGLDFPVTDIAFSPALPDVRRPFDGVAISTFAVDIAGQEGHGKGEIRSRWVDADTVELQIRPIEPRWFADRPLDVKIRHDADGVRVRAYRVEPE